LFPGGIATDCVKVDPAELTITLAALRARKDCTGARWRRSGGNIELQETDHDAWDHDQMFEHAGKQKGFRADFEGKRSGGSSSQNPFSDVKVIIQLESGNLRLTRTGEIRATDETTISRGGIGRESKSGVEGRYEFDGYILRISTSDGGTVRRYVVLDDNPQASWWAMYFNGRAYLKER